MVISVIAEDDADSTLDALRERGFLVTTIASSGGFLHKGNATLLMGIPAWRVDEALRILRENCSSDGDGADGTSGFAFVLATDRFQRLD